MNSLHNTFKNLLIIALAVLCIILYFRGCNKSEYSPENTITTTTTVRIDTLRKTDTSYVPKPYKVYIKGENVNTTDTLIEIREGSSGEPYTEIAATKYNDTLKLDTFGYVVVKDDVKGYISKREFNYTVFQKTVETKIVKEKKIKNKVYIGVEAFGAKEDAIQYTGVGAIWQGKKENILKFSAGMNPVSGKVMYGAGYFFKIKLLKTHIFFK
jgi:hypothetical protein